MFKTIDLALQGGGSHGAFTWGVLERLLEARGLVIEGICGTSAGAMNAVMVAEGMRRGGRSGAITMLEKFWTRVADTQKYSLLRPSLVDKWLGNGRMDYSPTFNMVGFYTQLFSPYQFNPMDYNPLIDLLEELVDFEALRQKQDFKLFVCATNVRTARARVFANQEISAKAVMASACLPQFYKAVEIDGEAYWDGGFMGNPPIFPLIDNTETEDILLIQINPIVRDKIPKTAVEIRDRLNEISFNASLMHEMRRINFVRKNLHLGLEKHENLRNLYLHMIDSGADMCNLGVSSKYNTDKDFLQKLREAGHKAGDKWIQENYDKLGEESTLDLESIFL